MKINLKWTGAALAALIIIGGGWYGYSRMHTETKQEYTLGKVERGNIGLSIDATGTIEPVNSVDLSATASGTLEQVLVKQNEQVTKGQKLAVIESKALTSTQQEALNTLNNKQSYYQRLYSLYKQGAVSFQTMDDAKLDYLNAKAAYEKAQADVNDTIVFAPMDGTVIGEPMKTGETVSQGLSSQMVIMTIADLSSMQIELLVDETDIGGVAIGQNVEFTVDAYPDRTFHGVVSNISKKEYSSSSSSSSGSSSSSSSVVYYTVYVNINSNELQGLYPSMTARATIKGKEDTDALIIPVTAVRSDTEGSYVYKMESGKLKKVYIKTGITTDTKVEVTSGLSAGDQVVTSGTISQETATTKDTDKQKRGGMRL